MAGVMVRNTGLKVCKMNWGQQIIEVMPGQEVEVIDPIAAAWLLERYPIELKEVKAESASTATAADAAPVRRKRGRPKAQPTINTTEA
ncbi:MAG TPA: hypothetical protein PLL10_00215 [Elusimicrobiales bacterium]|nr:hypothetical protein [Elusimicrobiales bacterium]